METGTAGREGERMEERNTQGEQHMDWFWLCSVPGLYRKDIRKLLEVFGTPSQVKCASQKRVDALPFLQERQKQSLMKHRRNFQTEEEYHKCAAAGIHFISHEEEAYPKRLHEISDYPFGIFFRGTMLPPQMHTVAVVGARMCTNYGRAMASELAGQLASCGAAVVSGMAYGIDGAAQAACLAAGGKSCAVLGCGVDLCYPAEHAALYDGLRAQGCVLSEYPPGTRALRTHFPLRNRIISGLAELTVVVEAKKKSGSLITADLALEQGRDVYAFPGRTNDALSAGCNALIAQGAGIVTDVESFVKELGWTRAETGKNKKSNIVLASAEKLVYSCLDSRAISLPEIAARVSLPVPQVMSAVCSLQLKDLIEETANNYYVRKI